MSGEIFFEGQSDEFSNVQNFPIEKYKFISVIGKGAFSTVLLVRSKIEGKYYAMKVMKKKRILQTGFTQNILTEKAILQNIDHPFMVKLKESFQDSEKLYLVMDYCPGGQLLGLLETADKLTQQQYILFLKNRAKFYAAQVLLVLQKLHEKKIIYRDLKPENILLDGKGYLKITDFGLSKALYEDQEKALSICGTPQYFTPEMIKRKGHNQSVDWWCFGCLLYEMVMGMPPFMQKNRSVLFEKILYEPIYLPPQISPQLKDLLIGLLRKDPHQRLGSGGAQEVKNHKWFKNVNFSHILSKSIKPPYIPVVHSQEDVSNFSKEFTNTSLSTFEEKYAMIDEQEEDQNDHFQGFDFGGHSRQDLE